MSQLTMPRAKVLGGEQVWIDVGLEGCSACRDHHDSLLAFARTDPAGTA